MQRKTLWFGGAVFLQLLLLLVILIPRWSILTQGKTVTLETMPYDPYSVFRGYYAELRYRISDPQNLPGKTDFKENQYYYVVLEPGEKEVWQPVAVLPKLPEQIKPKQAVIRGRYRYAQLLYQIEQYYLPEAQRRRIEALLRDSNQKALVEIKVKDNGRAAIVKLNVGGEGFRY